MSKWRNPAWVPLKDPGTLNADRNKAAIAKMDRAQRICGLTRAELDAEQARLRKQAQRRV